MHFTGMYRVGPGNEQIQATVQARFYVFLDKVGKRTKTLGKVMSTALRKVLNWARLVML